LSDNTRGVVLILVALLLPVLIGAFGLALEGSNWYQAKQAMQNAADTAAVAAATNGGTSYAGEALAVTAQYGFTNGVGGTVVSVSNTASCPAGGTGCYSVTIQKPLQLIFAQLVGYRGTTTIGANNAPAQQLSVTAVATQDHVPRNYCVLALAGSGVEGIRTNGAPKADLTGCDVMSNTTATCNGHNLKATFGDAHGTNNGCGITATSNVPVVADPYSSLASNVPPDSCASYPQEPAKKKDPNLPSNNLITGVYGWTGTMPFCGDVQLTGDVTLTGSNLVLVIVNGQLDTNGYTLKTNSGAAVTIIFTGDNTSGYTHAPTGGGTLDITAPKTGSWSGVAIYQDPDLTSGVDISAAGNSPTWDITGLVYLPHSSVTFSGAVNKSTNGQSCFVLVTDNLTINGTGSILGTGGCSQAGLTMPTSAIASRGRLAS
jgi:Flp pilus assembly protein TadG